MYHLQITKSTNANNSRKIEVIENQDYETIDSIKSTILAKYQIELNEEASEYFVEKNDLNGSAQYYFIISHN